ncbi:MAG: sigma-70 family RNA polymerase sigma factor [Longimicrobiales bacterium]
MHTWAATSQVKGGPRVNVLPAFSRFVRWDRTRAQARTGWRGAEPPPTLEGNHHDRVAQAMSAGSPVTALLLDWRRGDQEALDRLIPLVYAELRHIAARQLRNERPDHTLEATALVHEAYGRLVDAEISWQDRAHFFAVAARTMRRVLVDHARAQQRTKRGAGAVRVTLDDKIALDAADPDDILALDRALDALAELDARKAEVVQLHFFGGLTYDHIAEALGISAATVDRDLRMARAWLFRALGGTA